MNNIEQKTNTTNMKTIYIKLEKKIGVEKTDIYLQDLGEIIGNSDVPVCSCKHLKIAQIEPNNGSKIVISISTVITCLLHAFPDIQIQSIGEDDVVVEYIQKGEPHPFLNTLKIAFVCCITFFGTAFSIMAFHTDIGIRILFKDIYTTFIGKEYPGVTALDISYSIGLCIGIIVFFNHIGKRKLTPDPTPVEVEMRIYEDDVNQTLIDNTSRNKRSSS